MPMSWRGARGRVRGSLLGVGRGLLLNWQGKASSMQGAFNISSRNLVLFSLFQKKENLVYILSRPQNNKNYHLLLRGRRFQGLSSMLQSGAFQQHWTELVSGCRAILPNNIPWMIGNVMHTRCNIITAHGTLSRTNILAFRRQRISAYIRLRPLKPGYNQCGKKFQQFNEPHGVR